jgi:hypothetical protein
MKNPSSILPALLCICLLGFILIGCEPTVSFVEPQPQGSANLESFPKGLHGNYLSEDGASVLSITDRCIYRTYDYEEVKTQDSVQTKSSENEKDTVLHVKSGSFELTSTRTDSSINHVHYVDTLFQLSNENLLRKFKGYYFLNFKLSSGSWEVNKLNLSGGKLSWGEISSQLEFNELQPYSESPSDSTAIRVKLNRKQFKDFIREDGFHFEETFTKIRL